MSGDLCCWSCGGALVARIEGGSERWCVPCERWVTTTPPPQPVPFVDYSPLPSEAGKNKHGRWKLNRLGKREGWRCHLCGRDVDPDLDPDDPMAPTADHLLPKSRGGNRMAENLRLAHKRCNELRGNTPPDPRWITNPMTARYVRHGLDRIVAAAGSPVPEEAEKA